MLILARKLNERIWIDERISVTIVAIEGHQVRLGFEAPRSINIRRAELPPYETVRDPTEAKDVN